MVFQGPDTGKKSGFIPPFDLSLPSSLSSEALPLPAIPIPIRSLALCRESCTGPPARWSRDFSELCCPEVSPSGAAEGREPGATSPGCGRPERAMRGTPSGAAQQVSLRYRGGYFVRKVAGVPSAGRHPVLSSRSLLTKKFGRGAAGVPRCGAVARHSAGRGSAPQLVEERRLCLTPAIAGMRPGHRAAPPLQAPRGPKSSGEGEKHRRYVQCIMCVYFCVYIEV